MKKYHLRIHIRVMNRGQWDVLKELNFSDEVSGLIGDLSDYVDGRSLVIDKTVSYGGFLFINPFLEIVEGVKCNVGECLCIGDYVEVPSGKNGAYVCNIGELSESEIGVSAKLAAADIRDIGGWLKARAKATPQEALALVRSFYGTEPHPAMFGPWSIEKEIQLRHNVFSKATFDEIVTIANANLMRLFRMMEEHTAKMTVISMITVAGQIGAAHGRAANAAEIKMIASCIQGLPADIVQGFVKAIEEPFTDEQKETVEQILKLAPQLASTILDMAFCFIYVDGKVEAQDHINLQKLEGMLSLPLSAMAIAMQFGEDVPNPPIDYAAYVSGINADTVVGMNSSDGFVNVNFGSDTAGIKVVSAHLSDEDVKNVSEKEKAKAHAPKAEKAVKPNKEKEKKAKTDTKSTAPSAKMAMDDAVLEAEKSRAIAVVKSVVVEPLSDDKRREYLAFEYQTALQKQQDAKTAWDYQNAAVLFDMLGDYEDANTCAEQCRNEMLEKAKAAQEQSLCQRMRKGEENDNEIYIALALKQAKEMADCEVVNKRTSNLEQHLDKVQRENAQKRKVDLSKAKNRNAIRLALAILAVIALIVCILCVTVFIPSYRYDMAEQLVETQQYRAAREIYTALGGYADSRSRIAVLDALDMFQDGDVNEVVRLILQQGASIKASYDLDGGSIDEAAKAGGVFKPGDDFDGLPEPAKDGHVFVAWQVKSYSYRVGKENCVELRLVATWTVREYTIEYQLNGGVNAADNPAIFTEYGEVSLLAPTRTGYTFTGWTYGEQTTPVKAVVLAVGSKGDKIYTANWSANTYQVSFDANGGNCSTNGMSMVYDRQYTLPTPTRTGYDFMGWYCDDIRYISGASKVASDATLVAQWRAKTFTVTYYANGGTLSESYQTVNYGKPYTLLTPMRPGYTFLGWYSGTEKAESGTWERTANLSLTAKWEIISYKITYNGTYGMANANPESYTVKDSIVLQSITMPGNEFLGWYSDSAYKNKVTKITAGETGNMVLYAKFKNAVTPIYSESQLRNMSLSGVYVLMNDINLDGAEWTPIGTSAKSFTGTFLGNGYVISNFKITSTSLVYVGLFGKNSGAIMDLGVVNFTINATCADGVCAGGLVGYNFGTVERCYASGSVTASYTNDADYKDCRVGGLIGANSGSVVKCYAAGTVSAVCQSAYNDAYAGGLCGSATVGSVISESYATATVNVNTTKLHSDGYGGGLLGYAYGSITNCYATGSVTVTINYALYSQPYVGGLIGYGNTTVVSNCYALGDVSATMLSASDYQYGYAGGFMGYSDGAEINSSYAVGDVTLKITTRSYAKGVHAYCGGFVGYAYSGNCVNCYRNQSQSVVGSVDDSTSASTVSTTGSTSSLSNLSSSYFHQYTLGWDPSVWNFMDGSHPTLR